MAMNKFLSMFQFKDDDYDDEDDEIDEPRRQSRKNESNTTEKYTRTNTERADRTAERYERPERSEKNERQVSTQAKAAVADNTSDYRASRSSRYDRASTSKVVPIKTNRSGLEVTVTKPSSFDDSQDICDLLLNGKAVVANLEGFDSVEAQRIMDFISGCVYAMNGNLHQISKYIFIFSPDNIDLSGDFLDTMSTQGFGVPTINHEF